MGLDNDESKSAMCAALTCGVSSGSRRIGESLGGLTPGTTWVVALAMIALVGWIDYFSGAELRVYPLYYAPISLLAWNVGRRGAGMGALLSATAWLAGNYLAGRNYSIAGVWLANGLVQAASFGIVGFLISALNEALVRERALSRTDPLTSLLNSRAFHEDGSRVLDLCRRRNHAITMAYLDLDNFKAMNDTQGHDAGDETLRKVADILRSSTRPSDICARLGGDEFAVLLPETDADEATVALERLRLLVAVRLGAMPVAVTCSLGAVVFRKAPERTADMISATDRLMYAAKAMGKNRLNLKIAD
jgi:diguanylate cyclase (GGDEF)-like protein